MVPRPVFAGRELAPHMGICSIAGAGWAAWAWHTALCGLVAGEQGRRDVHVCFSHTDRELSAPKHSMISEAAH